MSGMRRRFSQSIRAGRMRRQWPRGHDRPPAPSRHGPLWPALLACLWLVVSLGWAADDSVSRVETDRPDVSNSTHTVPVRALQVELGLEYARSHNDARERRLALQTTLRTGLSGGLELRLDGEPLVRLKEDSDHFGLGDLALGLKARLFEPQAGQGWPALGVQPFVKLPTARTPLGSGRLDGGVLILADQDLPWEMQLTVNAGLVVGQPHGALVQDLASASLARELWGRLNSGPCSAYPRRLSVILTPRTPTGCNGPMA
jgi:hypothetical protein